MTLRKFPWLVFGLVGVTAVTANYSWDTGKVSFTGPAVGTLVAAFLFLMVLSRIRASVRRVCQRHGIEVEELRSPYERLLLLAILLALFRGQWFGPEIMVHGTWVPRWEFRIGVETWSWVFVAAFALLLGLLRVRRLLERLERSEGDGDG